MVLFDGALASAAVRGLPSAIAAKETAAQIMRDRITISTAA